MKTAFVSGITGQDGSYLAELLLRKGYFVVGLKRRTSLICTERINSVYNNSNFKMEYWDLNDSSNLADWFSDVEFLRTIPCTS